VTEPSISFPRQFARTRRFSLGQPRHFAVAKDGSRVAFLRSPAGDDPNTALWVLDVSSGSERLVADPHNLIGSGGEDLPPEERARRERTRERAQGVVAYAADPLLRVAAFALSGRLFVADLVSGGAREVAAAGPVLDPRPDPTGSRVAYVSDGALHVVDLASGGDRALAQPDGPEVTWGLAEFVAAEEMDRLRGFWWAPDGTALTVARVDPTPIARWFISDPADPSTEPAPVRYPAAGTANADVALVVLGLDGSRTEVGWDREALPYLARVVWNEGAPLTLLVLSRDQRRSQVLTADPTTGRTEVVREEHDDAWLDIVSGVPAWLDGKRLVTGGDRDDTHRILVDGEPVTPAGLQVRRVVHAADDGVIVAASEEPTEQHLWRASPRGGEPERLTSGPGVHDGVAGGDVLVVVGASPDRHGAEATVWRGGERVAAIASNAELPVIEPRPRFLRAGSRELRTAILLPADVTEDARLPVLMDPYAGPHAQRVVASRDAFLQSQWFADQGFAVVVADGRGTPGRGPRWERAVHLDLASAALEDQVDALHAAAQADPRLDLGRVAIRGWSFGGYLAALAVLRRPDVFHAAVAGAPVTDWRLYDTCYTERYLGHPDEQSEAYRRSSLLEDAPSLTRPLLLIHGLADDNVVVAHTLHLSRALLEAGRPHRVLPLSGATHMTPQEVVEENLLLLQLSFLREALAKEPPI
jgi:dipeptidyl-peptidase-4